MPAKISRTTLTKTLKALLATGLALVIYNFHFHFADSYLYDLQFRTSPATPTHPDIVLVTVSRQTLDDLGRNPNLIDLGLAVRALNSDSPKLIVSMLPLPDQKEPLATTQFFSQAATGTPFYFAREDVQAPGDVSHLSLPRDLQRFPVLEAALSADKTNFAADGVSRRTIVAIEGRYLGAAEVAKFLRNSPLPEKFRGEFEFRNSRQVYTDFRESGSYPRIEFRDASQGRFPKGSVTGKVVLIGVDSGTQTDDYLKNPFSRDATAMSKVEVFANGIDTLAQNSGPIKTSNLFQILITVAVSLLTVYFVFVGAPVRGFLALLAMAALYTFLSWSLFAAFKIALPTFQPLLAIFVCYYFFIPYRLIQESRRSWEYLQKNKLLTEVEQLKTNFLSMMSHDLKTPLARIQGMTDIVLTHQDNLSPEQQLAIKTIGQSTDELSTFITSILDLSRVESQEIKLHLQPKDINSLLEEVIARYDYNAKVKKVEIVREFEPLFSTKVDVALMKQVFSNLIENAIKYSSEGSKILVSTEEVEGRIQVQVADQGVGIPTNEQKNVFHKFYRSSTVKNGPIKGSGLGLFLAKYFVELHKGQISVESVPTQGSTFTVDLPIQ